MPLNDRPSTASQPVVDHTAARAGLRTARGLLGLLDLVAIGWQLELHTGAAHDTVQFFSYFTILSNLCAALVLLTGTLRIPISGRAWDLTRLVAATNMVVVALVYQVLLSADDTGSLRPWINFVLHYFMPVAVAVEWLLAPPRTPLSFRAGSLVLPFPLAYLAYSLIRGAATGWYPYPFIDPTGPGGYGGVSAYAAGIALLFLVVGWGFRAVGNWRRRHQA